MKMRPVIVALFLMTVSASVWAFDGNLNGAASLGAEWNKYFPPWVLLTCACLLAFSAFFSGSETALFSIHKVRLRSMRTDPSLTARKVAYVMDDPGRVLTTILVGNMIVNTCTAVLLGSRMEKFLSLLMPDAAAYLAAVVICTGVLILFGEITPKVMAIHGRDLFARYAVLPLLGIDWLLTPLRAGFLRITDFIFAITRFKQVRAAPFITDEELKSMLAAEDNTGSAEDEGREMIRRILEFGDVLVREIIVPRPDVVALPETASVREALDVFREHEYSRMPTYTDDLDHITGVLVAKDLLPSLRRNELDKPVTDLVRPPRFIPETMTLQQFVKEAQRSHTHLAIVVDEFGGTEGIATLHDALQEVVGDIGEADEEKKPAYTKLGEGVYRVEGGISLDELTDILPVAIRDEEHETIAGFLMHQTEKVLRAGDQIEHSGVLFTVEAVEGKRVAAVRLEFLEKTPEDGA